jgi:hypothetical protein
MVAGPGRRFSWRDGAGKMLLRISYRDRFGASMIRLACIAATCVVSLLLSTPGNAQSRLFSSCACACVGGQMRHVGCSASERMRLMCPSRPCDQGNLSNLKGPAPLGCEWRSVANPDTGDLEMQRVCEEDEDGNGSPDNEADSPDPTDSASADSVTGESGTDDTATGDTAAAEFSAGSSQSEATTKDLAND